MPLKWRKREVAVMHEVVRVQSVGKREGMHGEAAALVARRELCKRKKAFQGHMYVKQKDEL
jgi:hypothetical protein